jgi:hypothetical protein
MKLYTEEALLKFIDKNFNINEWDLENGKIPHIELPSDEEIVQRSKEEPENSDIETAARIGYVAGAKWLRNKIQGSNK